MSVHEKDKETQIKELLGIPEEEPIFILRAQDKLFRPMLNFYEEAYGALVKATNENGKLRPDQEEFQDQVYDCSQAAKIWQTHNADKVKIPD